MLHFEAKLVYTIVSEWLVVNLKQNEAQSARAESTHKGVNQRSKYVTQAQQKRPESPTVTYAKSGNTMPAYAKSGYGNHLCQKRTTCVKPYVKRGYGNLCQKWLEAVALVHGRVCVPCIYMHTR